MVDCQIFSNFSIYKTATCTCVCDTAHLLTDFVFHTTMDVVVKRVNGEEKFVWGIYISTLYSGSFLRENV